MGYINKYSVVLSELSIGSEPVEPSHVMSAWATGNCVAIRKLAVFRNVSIDGEKSPTELKHEF